MTEVERSSISNRSVKLFTLSGIYNATNTLLGGLEIEATPVDPSPELGGAEPSLFLCMGAIEMGRLSGSYVDTPLHGARGTADKHVGLFMRRTSSARGPLHECGGHGRGSRP